MKKYKHLRLEIIAEWNERYEMYETKMLDNTIQYLNKGLTENSNDWEEVKEEGFTIKKMIEFDKKHVPRLMKEEPNYLITAFKYLPLYQLWKHDTQLKDSYCLIDGKAPFYSSGKLLSDKKFEIYSVKNSKGEEFTIGEEINTLVGKCKITKFNIVGHLIICDLLYAPKATATIGLENISKIKTAIYTTTDGIEIFEGQDIDIWVLNKDTTFKASGVNNIKNFSKQDKEVADRYLTFTSEENRDKYIKENTKKPIFVSADGKEMYEGDKFNLFSVCPKANWEERTYSLKQASECKAWMHFHTKEARQEYIDNNKPKYSLADIENCYPHANVTGNRIKDIPVVAALFSNLKKLGK